MTEPVTAMRPLPANIVRPKTQHRDSSLSQKSQALEAYQISFSCAHIGRYVPSSKRKISWRFGLTGLGSFKGYEDECRGQEHEMHLIWSLQSRKTRVVWNNTDITNLISEGSKTMHLPTGVEYAWQGSLGMNFRIVAYANAGQSGRQYDLFICERSFFSLPLLSELISRDYTSSVCADYVVSDDGVECFSSDGLFECHSREPEILTASEKGVNCSSRGSLSNDISGELDGSHGESLTVQQQNRLAAAGFSCLDSFDELRSDLYSSTLDTLRAEMAATVPQTEDMVSKAIIDAFAEDHDSGSSDQSFSIFGRELNKTQMEAEVLFDTFQWINQNEDVEDNSYAEDSRLRFMQEQVNLMVSHVRHERISASDATKILQNVAAMLELRLSRPLPRNTLILAGLGENVKHVHLVEAMQEYGCIQSAYVVEGRGFGFCRFGSSSPVILALEASNRNQLTILKSDPRLLEIGKVSNNCGIDPESRSDSNDEVSKSSRHACLDEPLSSNPHLLEPMDDDDTDMNEVTPPFTRHGRPRSFPSYESGGKYSYGMSDEPPGAKVLSPSDGTTSTASSLEVDELNFLSFTTVSE